MPRTLLVLLTLALLAAPAASLTLEGPPDLTEGDTWTRVAEFQQGQLTYEVTQNATFAGAEELTLNGTAYQALRLETHTTMRGTGPNGTLAFSSVSNSTQWMRTSDHALLASESSSTFQSPQGARTSNSSTTYHAPCEVLQWPMAVNDTWSVSCDATVTQNGQSRNITAHHDYRVIREETVEVPAGTFQALVIENGTADEDRREVQWFAPAACGPAKVTTSAGGQTFELDL
ncbi:MAG: hypothetical protein R3185_07575, partial [Candidatus Thermoplasmatota archaeon]|nr:hypothetical protein [Candidatus Thermoplasmatota archaeon]